MGHLDKPWRAGTRIGCGPRWFILVLLLQWALPLAWFCFIVRQPLMSMAGPAISELTMSYVGERNRELMSACNGAIWSGSWWLAARVFQVLRAAEMPDNPDRL